LVDTGFNLAAKLDGTGRRTTAILADQLIKGEMILKDLDV
jgi:hypothetical protein